MKKILICVLFLGKICYSQVSTSKTNSVWIAKEFSKEIALFNSKDFLFNSVLNPNEKALRFEVLPLSAASSGELTTLLYKCQEKNLEGLVLGFYGSFWNESGIVHTGFGFKNLNKEKATEFLNKINDLINTDSKYLKDDSDSNNVVFRYDDIDVLIYYDTSIKIRLFYGNFDSTWEKTAFDRSYRRFERKKSK